VTTQLQLTNISYHITGHSNGITRVDIKFTNQNEYIFGDPKKFDLNFFQKTETKIRHRKLCESGMYFEFIISFWSSLINVNT
jgi:hypothetical protein